MAYNIIKHRRGTTQEWLETVLIPEDGELIIEECSDNTRKCKIGNGKDSFAKLPYLSSDIEARLTKLVSESKSTFDKKLLELDQEFRFKLANIVSSSEENLATTAKDLVSLISAAEQRVTAQINLTASEVTGLERRALDADKELKNAFETSVEDLEKSLKQEYQQDKAVIQQRITVLEQSIEDLLGSTDVDADTVRKELQADLADIKDDFSAKIKVLDEKLEASEIKNTEALAAGLTDLSQTINKNLYDSNADLRENISNLSTHLDSVSQDFKEQLAQIKATDENLESKISNVTAELAKKELELTKTFEAGIATSETKQKDSLTKLTLDFNKEISRVVSEYTEVLNELKASLIQKDGEASDRITDLENADATINSFITEINNQLKTLDKSVSDLVATDTLVNKKLFDINNTLVNETTALQTALDALSVKHVNEHVDLLRALNNISDTQQLLHGESLSLLHAYVSAIYAELSQCINNDLSITRKLIALQTDLDNSVSTIQENLTSSVTTLSNTITEQTQSVAAQADQAIKDAKKDVEDKILAVETNLGTEITNTRTDLEGSIFNSEERLLDVIADEKQGIQEAIKTEIDKLSAEISSVVSTLRGETNSAASTIAANLGTFKSTINLTVSDMQKAIDTLERNAILDNAFAVTNVSKLNTLIEDNKTKAETADSELSARIDNFYSETEKLARDVERQSGRLDTIVALKDGSTTGDAELIEARTAYNGINHPTLRKHLDALGESIENLRTELPSISLENAVNGLEYEGDQLWLTSNGQMVGDPVTITSGTGGGGGGSFSTVRVQNNLASTAFTVAKGNPVVIDFTYTSFENEVPTGEGTYIITINNKKVDLLSGSVQHGVAKKIDIAEHLKNGSNNVKVTCTDQYGTARSLVYNISVIELRISSTFESGRIFDDSITFRYKVAGQVEKTVHILLDGKEISTTKLAASVNNSEITLNIPKQAHGCHSLLAYITATLDSTDIRSNELRYELLCSETDRKEAMIASVFEQKTATQGDLLTIPYMVYDPGLITSDVELIIYSQVGGELREYSRTSASVGRELVYWNTRQYPVGQATFKILYSYSYYGEIRTVEKTHTVTVEALKIDISPEEDGLQVYLSSQGRSNTDSLSVRDKWTFNSANQNEPLVTTKFENFNWSTNGWVKDKSDDICLRLNGDARATINFKPFSKDFQEFGKTLEFEFAVRDVNSRDAIVIDCFDGTRGFRATPDTAFLQSSGTKVSCRFKDEERIRVAITVEHGESGSNFVSIYLDGVLSGVQKYDTKTDTFKQASPLPITLGSSFCGVDIYAIRIYDKALSTAQILKNYIADKAEPATKLKLMTDNDVLDDETGELSYQRVQELGQIPIVTFTGAMPTFKGDKKKNSVYMSFEDPLHPELNFTDVLLKEIDVQGTSSAGYVRKNWKIKLPDSIQHMPGAIPAKVYCIKVDYAEATGTHNTGTANYVETLYDRNQSIIPPQLDNPDIRTTIQGFPCVIFEKANADAEPVFSSKGNFNYDKGSEGVFGFTDDYAEFGAECWEFCNNISDAVSFLGPIPDDWKDDFEPRYTPIKSPNDPENTIFDEIEDLLDAKSKAEKGDGVFTSAQQEELSSYQAMCIRNFKELHDWVLSTATYKVVSGNRVSIVPLNDAVAAELPDAETYKLAAPVTYAKTTYEYDTEEYRLAKFKNEFEDHFDMHYATMYYVFTLFALMVDQRAKNLFLTRWKNDDGKYRWYPYFYDNDTIFGINNVGALVFDYFHEDTDQIASSDVYNGQNSTLWNNFRLCFANEIEDLYRTLRSDSKITYDKIIDQFVTNHSDKWSAAIYNADAEYKYVSMARPDENGAFDANNLKQVRGPGEHHLRYFIANRINYCDSKWFAGSYPSDKIVVRLYTPKITEITDSMTDAQKEEVERTNARIRESQEAVPASSVIKVTPYSDMYAGVAYASGTRLQRRLAKGEEYTFTAPPGVNTNDSETDIYGASMLSSLGDLSNLYCDYLDLHNATKLIHLKIGHEDPRYHNDNIKNVTLGNNRLLKTIDVRNCSGLGVAGDDKTLILSGCQNIETIYAEGTNLAAVSLPTGGYIKTLHLPASINTLVIQDHQHINDFSIESYENIKTLRIENCPTLDTKAMLESCKQDGKYSVEYVYLTGFNWGSKESPVSVDFIKGLFPVFDEDGKLISGVLGIKANGETTTDPAFLDGTCYVDEISGADYTEIKSYFPYLKINFGTMKSNVTFRYSAANNSYSKVVEVEGHDSALGECTVPNLIPQPTRAENDAFTYQLAGWSEMEQISKGVEDSDDEDLLRRSFPDAFNGSSLKNIAGDRVLYPVFRALRKSYEIKFMNLTAPEDSQLVHTLMVPYGYDASDENGIGCDGRPIPTPIKQDAASPDLYTFTSWHPSPVKITGAMTCYAQFTVLDSKWYTIGLSDITDCEDYNGNIFDGYVLNTDNKTMSITECNNKFNPAVKIPAQFDLASGTFKVVSLGGFSDHTSLELINLPSTLTEIQARAFYSCYNMFEIDFPEALTTIGRHAFQGCVRLKDIYIPASVTSIGEAAFADCNGIESITVDENNERYYVKDDCLIDKDNGLLLQGLSTGKIPQDGSIYSLGQYCFSNTAIKTIWIPDNIDIIPNNAFSRCESLYSVSLPDNLHTLDATCFAWCPSLVVVNLPESLVNIRTYVFDSCSLSAITIPAAVETVLERAFGDMPSLKKVKFNKPAGDGPINVPYIHVNAFVNSGAGTEENPMIFEVPWTSDQTPDAPWGATGVVKVQYSDRTVEYRN